MICPLSGKGCTLVVPLPAFVVCLGIMRVRPGGFFKCCCRRGALLCVLGALAYIGRAVLVVRIGGPDPKHFDAALTSKVGYVGGAIQR